MMKTFRTATGERVAARITAEDIRNERLYVIGMIAVSVACFLCCVFAAGII